MENGFTLRHIDNSCFYTNDIIRMDVDKTKDIHKRINQTTGKPFQEGDVDLSGRVFKKYHHKIGNDGYYLEIWSKTKEN